MRERDSFACSFKEFVFCIIDLNNETLMEETSDTPIRWQIIALFVFPSNNCVCPHNCLWIVTCEQVINMAKKWSLNIKAIMRNIINIVVYIKIAFYFFNMFLSLKYIIYL